MFIERDREKPLKISAKVKSTVAIVIIDADIGDKWLSIKSV